MRHELRAEKPRLSDRPAACRDQHKDHASRVTRSPPQSGLPLRLQPLGMVLPAIRGYESFWVEVVGCGLARMRSLATECLDVSLPRQQESKESDPPVSAGLLDAQQSQVIL